VVSFPQVSPPKPCTRLSPTPSELHAQPISFFPHLSNKYKKIWPNVLFVSKYCLKQLWRSEIATHHISKHNTPIHNILSTAPQLSISWKALGTVPEESNVMPKHVGATIHN
jgi:hypothetical protein